MFFLTHFHFPQGVMHAMLNDAPDWEPGTSVDVVAEVHMGQHGGQVS